MSNVVKNVSYANGFELGTEFELRAIDKFVILFFFSAWCVRKSIMRVLNPGGARQLAVYIDAVAIFQMRLRYRPRFINASSR